MNGVGELAPTPPWLITFGDIQMSLNRIESILDKPEAESDEELLGIVKDTAQCAVGIFGVSVSTHGHEQLHLSGSGTLVYCKGSYFILTARHVWEDLCKHSSKLGITLMTSVDHRFWMEIDTISSFGPAAPDKSGELGPDIVMLRIPDIHVNAIKAYGRAFYDLDAGAPHVSNPEYFEMWMLVGVPACLGTFSNNYARIQIRGWHVGVQDPQTIGEFDYCDALANVSDLPSEKSVGGVSGGGLWRVSMFDSPSGESVQSVAILDGLAFWQFPLEGETRIVRCHGIDTIKAVARTVGSNGPAIHI
jgi:hypothetical protein